jgi:hypothetical protein
MIKINLLPPSERPVDRTPLPRFLLILTTVAAAAGAVAFIAYLIFVQVRSVNTDLSEKKKELLRYKDQVAQYDSMQKQITELATKIKEIDSIAGREFPWWQIVDAIWIDEIKILDDKTVQGAVKKSDPTAKNFPAYGVSLKCHAAAPDPLAYGAHPQMLDVMAAFRLDLKKHPLLAKYLPQVNFNIDFRVQLEKDFYEGASATFEVTLLGETKAAARPAAPGRK